MFCVVDLVCEAEESVALSTSAAPPGCGVLLSVNLLELIWALIRQQMLRDWLEKCFAVLLHLTGCVSGSHCCLSKV